MDHNVSTVDQGKSPGQLALHSSQLALHLPTMKVCAVVLNCELEIHLGSVGCQWSVVSCIGLGSWVVGLWSSELSLTPSLIVGLLPHRPLPLLSAHCLLPTALSCFRA